MGSPWGHRALTVLREDFLSPKAGKRVWLLKKCANSSLIRFSCELKRGIPAASLLSGVSLPDYHYAENPELKITDFRNQGSLMRK